MAAAAGRLNRPPARLEPPAPGQIARPVGKAVSTFEERFCEATVGRLSAATRSRLDDLIAADGTDAESAGGGGTFFTEPKGGPGRTWDSLPAEMNKLQRVRGLQLPPELFADVSEKLVAAWRTRAAKEYPSDLRAAAGPGAVHAAVDAVARTGDGDHRLAGGAVHPARAEDRHAGRRRRSRESSTRSSSGSAARLCSSYSNHWRRMLSPL
ncbi:hypothetical protein ACIBCU_37760 [Streptomyces sp. NPDC051064]|uniref:hypothetical protein n=1 Tax=Streptomyces sp. NPDC051064 TaxID=3365641 RepID=UPI003789F720